MAAGPLPKEQHQRDRDTKRRKADVVEVKRDGEVRGRPLPSAELYDQRTIAWHDTWRRSPQAQLFEETDWLRLELLAPLVDSNFRRPSAAALSEIRLNEERLGALYVDRLRAKIRIAEPESSGHTAPVLQLATRADAHARLRGETT
ncbi:hypothetical protein N1031_06880 [Herbiconiux moechotypicola]|uniref:Terminase small subunit n=1 Tax=Herbiconiux moechotypicola TaxID=637393 RepID=A0ABN3DFW3_9MICO|nr:hypothetical protein [Herbiconiux moechotypicola]MCS5729480.1 hypothetical protein [Herbiconiux moechotypicola]